MAKRCPIFKRYWLHDEIRIFGFRLDIYTGREKTLPGFEISRPKKDAGFSQEWRTLSVCLKPFNYMVRKDGHYYTSTGE